VREGLGLLWIGFASTTLYYLVVIRMEGLNLWAVAGSWTSSYSHIRRSSQAAPVCVGIVRPCSASELARSPFLAHISERLITLPKDRWQKRQRIKTRIFHPINLQTGMALQKTRFKQSSKSKVGSVKEACFLKQRRPQDAPPRRRHTECAITASQVQARRNDSAPAFKSFLFNSFS
jgi:hypothetical protein